MTSPQRRFLMVGLFNYVLVFIASSDEMIFNFWGYFNMHVTSSHSLPGGRKMPPTALFSTNYSVHLWNVFVTCFIYFAPHIPAFLEEEVNKPPCLFPRESNFFTLGGPSVSPNTALLWLELNTSCPRHFASCRFQEMEQLKVVSLWCQIFSFFF